MLKEPDQERIEDDYVHTTSKDNSHRTHMIVKVDRQDISFLVDTGATVDIVHSTTFEKLANKVFLQKSSTKIYACGFQTPLQLKGYLQATLESKQWYPVSQIYVIDSTKGHLLSAKTPKTWY